MSQLYAFGFGPDGPLRTVGLTSAKRGEGVTTVACNLALYAADCHGLSVLLVDANHASPQLNSVFRIKEGPGLAELLTGDDLQLADCVHDLSSQPLECWPAPVATGFASQSGSLASIQEPRRIVGTSAFDFAVWHESLAGSRQSQFAGRQPT